MPEGAPHRGAPESRDISAHQKPLFTRYLLGPFHSKVWGGGVGEERKLIKNSAPPPSSPSSEFGGGGGRGRGGGGV